MLRKTKKDYYEKLNDKDVNDNKTFWKTVKPFLSESHQWKTTRSFLKKVMWQTLNSFFSNIVTNLKIPEYKDYDISFNEDVSDPIIKLILKYRNHPSILTIGEVCKNKLNQQPLFSFSKVTKNEIVK